eukprot:snap_masked-scaffold2114_size20529-processed-gene-0.1 protein:Tk04606 transcript:snap_masked-scaffold2114_size20529-processed-gene-0.1-mRNA-1 annotation:"calcitonin gene-related peptide type 1 receptor"
MDRNKWTHCWEGTLLPLLLLMCWCHLSDGSDPMAISSRTLDTQSTRSTLRNGLCRSRGNMLSVEAFRLETCYLCYYYMPESQFVAESAHPKWNAVGKPGHRVDGFPVPWLTNGQEMVLADIHANETTPILKSFANEKAIELWKSCCRAAEECCHKIETSFAEWESSNLSPPPEQGAQDISCSPTWDGWQCWPDGGRPDQVMTEPCPKHIFFHTNGAGIMDNTCGRYAEKYCNSTGEWLQREDGEWTDFTTCSRVNVLRTQEYVHLSLYGVSIIALVPAIVIFFSYKVLRVPRIAIHKNLFGSLLAHCITMVIFKSLVLLPFIQNRGDSMLTENTWDCRLLMMLSKYFRLTNYTWMYCEGYYLHRLLANTFEEERSLKVILSIGWGLPMIPCIVYGILRVYVDNTLCWALPAESHEWVEWIYMIPGLLCIVANMFFFINIFRILVTKLQAPHANEPAHFRKAVHATVVLLPLFGLHWLLTLYRPQEGAHCHWQTFYKYLNICLDGLQGLMVSIAFCYRNGEIRYLLKQSKKRMRERFFPHLSSGSPVNIQLKDINRKNSETCFTQVGYTTVAGTSQVGS